MCPPLTRPYPLFHNRIVVSAAANHKPVVLVSEDSTDARELFQVFLEFEGFEVVTAANGQEAVDTARELHPDVVVMDLSMPVKDGFSATEENEG